MSDKKKVEAVLFSTGRFMTVEEIAQILNVEVPNVKQALDELEKEYQEKDSAMTIQSHENRYKLNIRKEFGYITNKLVSSTEMDSPTTKTLAVIAFKNPALQSDVIKIRGNKAYDHILILKEQGLVTSERYGRTRLLKLTDKFFDYFDTAEPAIKEKFKEIEEKYKETLEELQKEDAPKETIKEAEAKEDKTEAIATEEDHTHEEIPIVSSEEEAEEENSSQSP
ncbi:MAG: SMC-Scp complex subunit ScpB [Candidatus Nanoarchaeia archaeon]|nr:SMC-Scp complex subunit ScpB [Candidatus Nanoarchaeia archaeon]